MFLYFIARKGWLLGRDGRPDRDFMRHFWEAYRASGAKDTFHREWLPVLFFEAFNNRWQNRPEYLKRFPKWLVRSLSQAPYLNGGLYARRPGLDDRLRAFVPDEYFALLFEKWTDGTTYGLFERYNFTVVETGRFDEEVAVDPEMLGAVYERLVNVTFEEGGEDLRGAAGIFYTPRVEIDLMCRLALVDWLSNQLGNSKRDLLYQWVFAFSEEEKQEADDAITREGLWEALDGQVRRARVCDPACGSGAFLVGMLLVLDDLQARCNIALGRGETPYERRKRILQDQLYGVDVMEWAVRVAELRLWLQLVVETELQPAELHFRPLLPNLDLKLRPGDSLLQTVGDLDLSPFRRSELSLPAHLKGRLTQLKGKKRRFFQGEEPGLTAPQLKQEEVQLFQDILVEKIHKLENQVKEKRRELLSEQGDLFNAENKTKRNQLEEAIKALEAEKARYQQVRQALRPDQPLPFVWDLAFVEVFEDDNPGFDIVIGNPPYVRQEKIRDYLGRFDRKAYLQRLNEGLQAIYPAFMRNRKISGRADYYVYFYLHGLSLLSDQGAFCFITSNSWLDVDFGKDLQEFFLRYGHLKMVIDNRSKRSFAQADVNTVIVLAGAPKRDQALTKQEMKDRQVRFVSFQKPFEEVLSPVVFIEIEDDHLYNLLAGFRVLKRSEYRSVLLDQWFLYQEGLEETKGGLFGGARKYVGGKWGGKYLRAPDIFFTILEKGKDKLVRLGDIAEVRFGIKTGANEFFYLEPVGMTVEEVEQLREKDPKAPVRVKNGAGWEGEIEAAWLRPVVTSLKQVKRVRVSLSDLKQLLFVCHMDRNFVTERAQRYIEWGQKKGYHMSATCRNRSPWWNLGQHDVPQVIFSRRLGDRYVVPYNDLVYVTDTLYEIYTSSGIEVAALMCTVLFRLFVEAMSRELTGSITVMEVYIPDLLRTFIVDPNALTSYQHTQLLKAFEWLGQREVKSIFEELGFTLCRERGCKHPEHPYEFVKPEELILEQVCKASPDRFALDKVVFDVLGLTEEERLQVYRAVVELIKKPPRKGEECVKMHLIYMDDSRDEKFCVFSALAIPENCWQDAFAQVRQFRRNIKKTDGIYVYKELHAWKFVSGRGKISDRVVPKGRRYQIFKETLEMIASLPGVRLFNAVFPAKEDERAFEWLLNRIQRAMETLNSRAILICDTGKEAIYTRLARRMHVHNPIPSKFGIWQDTGSKAKNIPIDRIIEDPFFKKSDHSYFIQLVDFCAYALLRRERPIPSKNKYGLDQAFQLLQPILVLEASKRDPEGIIRP